MKGKVLRRRGRFVEKQQRARAAARGRIYGMERSRFDAALHLSELASRVEQASV